MNDKDITSEVEYAIWGVVPNDTEESLLCTHIRTVAEAKLKRAKLINKFHITKLRIQTLVLNECPSKLWKAGLTNEL
jgi:hypothetical protein